MAKSSDDASGGFDLVEFRKLLQLMEKYGVTETQLKKGDETWKVRRGPRRVSISPEHVTASVASSAPAPAAPHPAVPWAQPPSAVTQGITIDAPTVGTFYAAANPDDEPFVSAGSTVSADTIVCVIEAMKVFNQIPAEKSGRIVEVLVENGDPVEYGQPLFRLEPA